MVLSSKLFNIKSGGGPTLVIFVKKTYVVGLSSLVLYEN